MEGLPWEPFHIPEGSEDVSLARLHFDRATRAQILIVRFPAGWRRPGPGYYEATEELVMLEGTLEMSGEIHRPGDWAYAPAGYSRTETFAPDGAVAFARFGGAARWVHGEGIEGPMLRQGLDMVGEAAPSPLGSGNATLLREGTPDSAWLVEGFKPGRAPVTVDLFDLDARTWAWADEGAPVPAFGRSFCRTYESF